MDIKMPKLGESVHEGTIEQWLVNVGDVVEEYDPLCEVITDKVTAEVPSSFSGKITELKAAEGDTIAVGEVICTIEVEGQESEVSTETEAPESDATAQAPSTTQAEQTQTSSNKPKNNGRFSPVVFKLASENNIDLSQVTGTGFEGRVTKKDIEHAIANGVPSAAPSQNEQPEQPVAASNATAKQGTPQPTQTSGNVESIPVTGVRKAIAQNMVRSVNEIPHAWMMVEVDATNLVHTRNHYKANFKAQEGYNLTFFAFFVKAVAESLKAFPMLNSSWQGSEIVINKDINISIAVADGDKLYVPVIKHADEKSIKGIAKDINMLAQKARNKKLTQEDMQGGSFTVNNTGTFGSVSSMGIINYPQAAILQAESIVKRPVVIDNMIAIRDMVNLCISIDHRILDGLEAGKFLNMVKQKIEQYSIEHTRIY